jgi:hypothetical protein
VVHALENSETMKRCQAVLAFAIVLTLMSPSAYAQDEAPPPPVENLADLISLLSTLPGSPELGSFLRFATSLEVATTPYGTSSGSFVFKLDPTTGLEVRTASTFGPAFGERAITAGAGQMSVAVNFIAATYDKINDEDLNQLRLAETDAAAPELQQQGFASLVLTSQSTVIQAVMGASDNLDIGAIIPIVKVRVNGIGWVQNNVVRRQANGQVGNDILYRAEGDASSAGVGDVGVSAKYRFLRFGGVPPPDAPLEPDPGGLAAMGILRLPTGSKDGLRGLGVTRAMVSLIASMGQGRLRPHGNVGFEWWDKGIDIASPDVDTVTVRHQVQYGAGIEFEASPKVTLLVDFLGRHVLGGGVIGYRTIQNPSQGSGFRSLTHAFATEEGIRKMSLIPGIKWNLKGKMLLTVSGIASLSDNGLHDMFTPVVGLDITF